MSCHEEEERRRRKQELEFAEDFQRIKNTKSNDITLIFLFFAVSLFGYLCSEVTRGYVLENDEERYIYRRQKMYTFMKIPRELEKFMSYGFFHCLDSFLFVFTFLPIRFLTAMLKLVFRLPLSVLRYVYYFNLLNYNQVSN